MKSLLLPSRLVAITVTVLAAGLVTVLAADKPDRDTSPTHASVRVTHPVDRTVLPSLAKISFGQALATASRAVKGAVIKGELEAEDGNLMYSFDIVTPAKTVMEVEIDAGNGKVLDVGSD